MKRWMVVFLLPLLVAQSGDGCSPDAPKSDSGLKKASVTVPTDAEGLTIEQKNIRDRLLADNMPGSVKHLYVISAYSGQTIIYSTVRGKVTSGGKRLTPTSVVVADGENAHRFLGFEVLGRETAEVLQDDGGYGTSMDYLYWWDTKGVYHQHYVSGGQIVHISDQPISVKGVIINMSATDEP